MTVDKLNVGRVYQCSDGIDRRLVKLTAALAIFRQRGRLSATSLPAEQFAELAVRDIGTVLTTDEHG